MQSFQKRIIRQALRISRRLISIIYGMLKSGTEYRMPVVENTGEKK